MDNNQKKALVLAGGLPQIELINNLKQRGYYVILSDYTPHPIAAPYADKVYRESTLDIEAITSIAKQENVDLVMTVCTDQALNTVAVVSEKLHLPCYIPSETALNVTNKRYMKRVFQENNIPSAKYQVVESTEFVLPDDFCYPLIVKPVDCNSSKGVVKIESGDKLKGAVDTAIQYSRTNNAIVEEYIDGKELSVDVYVYHGKARILCVSESQKIKDATKFIIFRSVIPAGIEAEAYSEIENVAQKIVDAFHLTNCPMLIQMLYKDGKVFVVEFSARTGGGLKFRLIKQNSGVDIIDKAVDAALGIDSPAEPVIADKYIINEFIYTKTGVFERLEGFEQLKNDSVIESYFAFQTPGTLFDKIASSGDRVASFTIIADSFEELTDKYNKTTSAIKVFDIDGNDMMRHDLTYPVDFRSFPVAE